MAAALDQLGAAAAAGDTAAVSRLQNSLASSFTGSALRDQVRAQAGALRNVYACCGAVGSGVPNLGLQGPGFTGSAPRDRVKHAILSWRETNAYTHTNAAPTRNPHAVCARLSPPPYATRCIPPAAPPLPRRRAHPAPSSHSQVNAAQIDPNAFQQSGTGTGTASDRSASGSGGSSSAATTVIIIAASVGGAAVLLTIAIATVIVRRTRRARQHRFPTIHEAPGAEHHRRWAGQDLAARFAAEGPAEDPNIPPLIPPWEQQQQHAYPDAVVDFGTGAMAHQPLQHQLPDLHPQPMSPTALQVVQAAASQQLTRAAAQQQQQLSESGLLTFGPRPRISRPSLAASTPHQASQTQNATFAASVVAGRMPRPRRRLRGSSTGGGPDAGESLSAPHSMQLPAPPHLAGAGLYGSGGGSPVTAAAAAAELDLQGARSWHSSPALPKVHVAGAGAGAGAGTSMWASPARLSGAQPGAVSGSPHAPVARRRASVSVSGGGAVGHARVSQAGSTTGRSPAQRRISSSAVVPVNDNAVVPFAEGDVYMGEIEEVGAGAAAGRAPAARAWGQ